MGALMDLVAGDAREILLAISVEDWAAFDDPHAGSTPTSRSAAGSIRPGSTCSPRPSGR